MALSGNFSTNHYKDSAVNETYLYFEWSATQNTGSNQSTISWSLKAKRVSTTNWVQAYNLKCTVNGTTYTIGSKQISNNDTIKSGSFTKTHSNDGTASFSASASGNIYYSSGGSVSGSGSWSLNTIPRYFTNTPSISVNSKTENSIVYNWSTSESCSGISWKGTGSASTSGVGGTSGTVTVTGLSANTSYTHYGVFTRKDSGLTSNSNSLTTSTNDYPNFSGTPSITFKSKAENSMTFTWSTSEACSAITWNGGGSASISGLGGTSGTITISGLSANTSYTHYGTFKRSYGGKTKNSNSSTNTTYNYPYLTSMPNFTVGNALTLQLYNPLGRSCTLTGKGVNGSDIFTGTTTSTSITGFNDEGSIDNQYKSLGTSSSGTYKVRLVCSALGRDTIVNGGTYSLNGNVKSARENVSGTWRRGKVWININGTWKQGIMWTNVNGTWKKGA